MYACGSPTQISYENSSESPIASNSSFRNLLLHSIRRKCSSATASTPAHTSKQSRKQSRNKRFSFGEPSKRSKRSTFFLEPQQSSSRNSSSFALSQPILTKSFKQNPQTISCKMKLFKNTTDLTTKVTTKSIDSSQLMTKAKQISFVKKRLTSVGELISYGNPCCSQPYIQTNSLAAGVKRSSLDFSRVHVNPLDCLSCVNKPRAHSESTLPNL